MTSFAKFSLVLAVVGMTALPSGRAQTEKTQIILLPAAPNMSCPMAMQAKRGEDGQMIEAGSGAHRGIGQRLQLTLNNPKLAAVSGVRITVHGWNAKGRTLPAVETASRHTNASRRLDLTLNIEPRGTADADVWVSGLTAVESIDLIGVSYADGSSWKPTTTQACRVIPDPVMLISRR